METGWSNFFNASHPIEVVDYPLLSDGLTEKGQYCLDRPGFGTLKVDYDDVRKNPEAPVALILHGYRGNPNGPNNLVLQSYFKEAGFATALIGFAGYDHYGQTSMPEEPDAATIPSNIDDVRLVLDAIDPARKVVIAANSASINAALPAACANVALPPVHENVSHILGVSPFPNIVSMLAGQIKQRGFIMPEGGYLIDPENDRMKITDTFLRAGQPVSLRHKSGLEKLLHRPKLLTVRSDVDEIVPKGLVEKWLSASIQVGFDVRDKTVRSESHDLTPEKFCALEEQVGLIAEDLGL